MAEPLKNIYNKEFIKYFCSICKRHIENFSEHSFSKFILIPEWENYELKQRMAHMTHALHSVLPNSYSKAIDVLINISKEIKLQTTSEANYEYIFISDYVAEYGLDYFAESMYAIENLTQLASAEFAIRPFIIRYKQPAMQQMLKWTSHTEAPVRRLASEGCRPRLPWSFAIADFKKDPQLILPILEALKTDDSLFVRKSVANNINDISKDNPEIALSLAEKWHGSSKKTDWIIKHGLRTLLKKGNAQALSLFGYKTIDANLFTFKLEKSKIHLGETLVIELKFNLPSKNLLRLEYAIGYQKAGNKISEKIFQISEKEFGEGQHTLHIKQVFKHLSTRKLYGGKHSFSLIVNGCEHSQKDFTLIV